MLTDDIYSRIEKSIFKISQSKNQSSINKKIEAFNAGVREYNELMNNLLQTITNETNYISSVQEKNAAKVAELLDKYDEILNNTKKAILNNTLSKLPTIDKIVADNIDGLQSVTKDHDYDKYASEIKKELEDYTNPFDKENAYYEPFVINSDIDSAKSDIISPIYDFGYKYCARIRKNANVKAIEFGFNISQFNLSHFSDSDFDVSGNYIGKPDNENIINRYYRGILFFTDIFDAEKFKVRAKLLLPDNDPLGLDNISIGPEIDIKYSIDNEYIYIYVKSFSPYRLDWDYNKTTGKYDYFDIYSDDHIEKSRVHFIINGFFDDLTRRNEDVITAQPLLIYYGYENYNKDRYTKESDDEESNETRISSKIISKNIKDLCILKPIEYGFIKYLNFESDSENVNVKARDLMLYTHSLKNTIKNSDFDNFYLDSIQEFYNFISDEYPDKQINIIIKNIDIIKNYIYLTTNHGVYAKNIDNGKIFRADNAEDESEISFYCVGYDHISSEILLLSSSGIFEADSFGFFDINSFIKKSENLDDIFVCIHTNKGVVLIKKNGDIFDFRYLYLFTSSDDLTEYPELGTRIYFNDKYIYFACNNGIIITKLDDLDNSKSISVADKISYPSCIIKSIFYNEKTKKNQVLYYDKNSSQFKLIIDLETSSSFTIRFFKSDFFTQFSLKDLYLYNHPYISDLILIGISDNKAIIGKANPEDIHKEDFSIIGKEFDEIKYDASSDFFSIDYATGNFIFNTIGFNIICKVNSYSREMTFEELRKTILTNLQKIKQTRSSILGKGVSVPYQIEMMGISPKDTLTNIKLSKAYTEFGLFSDYKTEDFEFHNTNSTLFAVNKNDKTIVYISSSDLNRFEEIPRNEKLYEMNLVNFPMGFARLVDYNVESECEYFIGTDGEIYQFGAYYPEVNSKNYLAKPRKIEFDHDEIFKIVIVIKDKVYAIDKEDKIHIKDAKNEKNKQFIREFLERMYKIEYAVTCSGIFFHEGIDKTISDYHFLRFDNNEFESNSIESEDEVVKIIGTLNKFMCLMKSKTVKQFDPIINRFYDTDYQLENVSDIIPFVYKQEDNYNPENITFNSGFDAFLYKIDNAYYLFKDISDVFSCNKIGEKLTVIENNLYSIVIRDEFSDYYNLGVSNGYHSSFRYTDEDEIHEIPDKTTFLGNDKIIKTFLDTNKTYIITESGKLFVSGSKNNKDPIGANDPKLGFEYDTENKNFFEEVTKIDFDPLEIKKIVFDNLCTFILLNNGDLYTCGFDTYGNMGIDSNKGVTKEFNTFILINKGVNNIWGGDNREFIEKIEDNKKVYYGAGSNEYGKLGALNNDEYRVWTTINIVPEYVIETIKEIYCFKDCTFALTESGSLYASGRNDNGRLGVDSFSHVYEFRLVNSASNVEKLYSNKDGSLIFYIDYSGSLYYAGTRINLNYREFKKEDIEYFVTEINISSLDTILISWEDRTDDIYGFKYYDEVGNSETFNSLDITRVKKIVSDKHGVFYLIHSGIGFLSKIEVLYENDQISFNTTKFYDKVEINATTSGLNYYSDIFAIPNTSVIKFVNKENQIGAIFTDADDLSENGYGTGFGLVSGTENVSNYGKMYLGVSNFDQDKEVNSVGNYFDYDDESQESWLTGELMGKINDIFKDLVVSVKLSIFPFTPKANKLEVEIPKYEEIKRSVSLIGKIS